ISLAGGADQATTILPYGTLHVILSQHSSDFGQLYTTPSVRPSGRGRRGRRERRATVTPSLPRTVTLRGSRDVRHRVHDPLPQAEELSALSDLAGFRQGPPEGARTHQPGGERGNSPSRPRHRQAAAGDAPGTSADRPARTLRRL